MLGTAQIISYVSTLGLAAVIPGPGMTTLVSRSVSGGAITGFTMLAGLILGDLIYLSVAVFGLAVIAHTYAFVFALINWVASLYLCVLAWKFWNYQPLAINTDQKATKSRLVSAWVSGLTITLGNPKTIAFYLTILPLVISLDNVSLQLWAGVLVPLTVLVLFGVGAFFIFTALKIRYFLTCEKSQRLLFRTVGFIMMLAATGMVIKTL